MGTKLRPLLRTDFSAFEISRFSGIVTTVMMVLVFERCCPVFSKIREVF